MVFLATFLTVPSLVLFCLITLILRRVFLWRKVNPRNLPYPPGPRPLPVIGNLLDLARGNEAAAYSELARKYGKICNYSIIPARTILSCIGGLVFLSIFGKKVLFVNSFHIANELFDKRSTNYSDRPYSPMIVSWQDGMELEFRPHAIWSVMHLMLNVHTIDVYARRAVESSSTDVPSAIPTIGCSYPLAPPTDRSAQTSPSAASFAPRLDQPPHLDEVTRLALL